MRQEWGLSPVQRHEQPGGIILVCPILAECKAIVNRPARGRVRCFGVSQHDSYPRAHTFVQKAHTRYNGCKSI